MLQRGSVEKFQFWGIPCNEMEAAGLREGATVDAGAEPVAGKRVEAILDDIDGAGGGP
jgi:hypothetical protein